MKEELEVCSQILASKEKHIKQLSDEIVKLEEEISLLKKYQPEFTMNPSMTLKCKAED